MRILWIEIDFGKESFVGNGVGERIRVFKIGKLGLRDWGNLVENRRMEAEIDIGG